MRSPIHINTLVVSKQNEQTSLIAVSYQVCSSLMLFNIPGFPVYQVSIKECVTPFRGFAAVDFKPRITHCRVSMGSITESISR